MAAMKEALSGGWTKLRGLTLRREGRMLGGVCAGLGEATPLAAWMWRVLFCTSTLLWGTGIVDYLILCLCVPNEE